MVKRLTELPWDRTGPPVRPPAGVGIAHVFGCALCACLALGAGAAWGADCSKAAQARLDQLKVDYGDIADQRLIARRDMYGRIVAYNAWFWFHSCSGNLVVQLSRWCQVRQVYWRGDCPAKEDSGGNGTQ
jgi:hypothetical protein